MIKFEWSGYADAYFWLAFSPQTKKDGIGGFFVEIARFRFDVTWGKKRA